MQRSSVTPRSRCLKEKRLRWQLGAYLKGASLWNRSQNCRCSASKAVHLCRRRATSPACRGATCWRTVMANFFMLFHFSGSSCKGDVSVLRPTWCSPPHSPKAEQYPVSSSLLQCQGQRPGTTGPFSTPLPWRVSQVACSSDYHLLPTQYHSSCSSWPNL